MTKNGNQRQYIFEWPGDASVDNFRFEFRQPLQSSNLSIEPALTNTILDAEGFQLSEMKQTGVKIGQKLAFTIKYQRDTDSPSTSFLKVQPSQFDTGYDGGHYGAKTNKLISEMLWRRL